MRWLALCAAAGLAALAADPAKSVQKAPPPKTLRVALVLPEEENVNAGDLKAKLADGKPARVIRVRSAKDDLLILLVFDTTGDLSLVEAARTALIEQLRTMPAATWTGLMRAQDGLQVILDPTPERDKFADALLALPIAGKAGLLDTVETAARLADSIASKAAVRVALLYVSDSDVRNYREDFTNPVINSSDSRDLSRRFPEGLIREKIARLAENMRRYQTPLFIVHLAYSSERLNQAYQSGLLQLAATTGGSAMFCRSQADISEVITRALTAIQGMQQVWIQLPARTPAAVDLLLEAQGRPLGHRTSFVLK